MRLPAYFLCLLTSTPLPLSAKVTFSSLFQDNAVLQRGKPVPVWGKADAGETVTVTYRGQNVNTKADADGNWRVALAAMEANTEPAELKANDAAIKQVLVGDVWLCSGQSNMVWPLDKCTGGAEAIASANLPLIRYFMVRKAGPEAPAESVIGSWSVCRPETAGKLSGVAFFFARDLLANTKVPVGIIQSAVSGSQIETWISQGTILSDPTLTPVRERWEKGRAEFPEAVAKYNVKAAAYKARKGAAETAGTEFREKTPRPPMGPGYVNFPTGHYNGMIAPLATYGIRGAIWYQGEGNATRGDEYRSLMPALIKQWRTDWEQGDFPFLIVQLPTFGETPWSFARVRDAQALTAGTVPKTYLVVTLDLGDPKNLHPANKEGVGKRVALVARKEVYGEADIACYGPMAESAQRVDNTLVVSFENAGGLAAKGGKPEGFEIASANEKYMPAEATILEDGKVSVTAPGMRTPVFVRYGWNLPQFNLFNGASLPAAPFCLEVK
jgi:sialate O-acetylesterase